MCDSEADQVALSEMGHGGGENSDDLQCPPWGKRKECLSTYISGKYEHMLPNSIYLALPLTLLESLFFHVLVGN